MFNGNVIRDTLLDLQTVSNITIHADKHVGRRTYQYAFNCDLLIRGAAIPVILCVPDDWDRELIHIYIKNPKNVPFMPHIEKDGKLCLFDLEGVLVDLNFQGLLSQCVERAVEILEAGLYEDTDEEFVREFSSYWSYLPNLLNMKVSFSKLQRSQIMKYIWEIPCRRKKQSYAQYVSQYKNTCIYASNETDYFRLKNLKGQQQNGLYCYINASKFIVPPDFRKPLSIDYFNKLLSVMEPLNKSVEINKAIKSQLVVFNINQPNGAETCIAIYFKNGKLKNTIDGRFKICESKKFFLSPIYVEREDKPFLIKRTNENLYNNRRILLIGCGSIGSYMCNELIKSGLEEITVVDMDILKAENIYRHLLGMEYVGQYKAEAICQYFGKNIPNLNMKPVAEDIREAVEEGSIDFSEFDLIVSAIGNHNVNRWINTEIKKREIDTTVVYEWNEPLDIGCHVAVISSRNIGCYECFFKRSEYTGDLYDAVAYTEPGQNVTRNVSGCGGSYIPYGSTVSLKTVAIGMDCIGRVLDGRCEDNYLISAKGDGYYFSKAGLRTSVVYMKQEKEITVERLSVLTGGRGCDVCRR